MDTLLLDSSFQPIGQVSWMEAIRLVVLEKVEIVEVYADWIVRSVSQVFSVPSVIRLLKAVGRKRVVRFSRDNVYLRDKGKCGYCSKKVSREDFTLDHVVPRALGGKTCWENVVVACYQCNQTKGDQTLERARMRVLHPLIKPKSLPGHSFRFRGVKIPESWQAYLRDVLYWHTELENDND